MPELHSGLVIPYSAAEMYALVDDVESYPDFVSWCAAVDVHERTGSIVRASLQFSQSGVRQELTILSRLEQHRSIELSVLEGPFAELSGLWRFDPLADQSSELSLSMRYEFDGVLLAVLLGPVFESSCSKLVEVFAERARLIYGPR